MTVSPLVTPELRQPAGSAKVLESSVLRPECLSFYRDAIARLTQAGVPVLVGGAYALANYTGIARHTKDLDLFLRRRDIGRAFAALDGAGYRTENTHAHWLGKVFSGDAFIDLIWSSGNGLSEVDDAWFRHATESTLLDVQVRLCPVEEMIWSKAFIMERERYDGADVLHLFHVRGPVLAWRRLLRRFGPHWRVLLSHLILFGFVYPGQQAAIPPWVVALLLRRLQRDPGQARPRDARCLGTLLSRQQYQPDLEAWGYRDGRAKPTGRMSARDIARWTTVNP
jgi:hypothetical protein